MASISQFISFVCVCLQTTGSQLFDSFDPVLMPLKFIIDICYLYEYNFEVSAVDLPYDDNFQNLLYFIWFQYLTRNICGRTIVINHRH